MSNTALKLVILGLSTSVAINTMAEEKVTSNILLKGSIYNSTCNIEINNQSASNNPTVNMGTWPASAFTGVGSEVGGTGGGGKITITAKDCPKDGSMRVNVTATVDDIDNSIIKLDNTGADATGVGIALYEADKDGSKTTNLVTFSKDYTFDTNSLEGISKTFYGVYRATATNVTAGNANATVHAEMTYN